MQDCALTIYCIVFVDCFSGDRGWRVEGCGVERGREGGGRQADVEGEQQGRGGGRMSRGRLHQDRRVRDALQPGCSAAARQTRQRRRERENH